MEYRLRASPEQFHLLLEFMERNGDLSRPQQGLRGKLRGEEKWRELAELLNSVGGSGVHKTAEKWKRVWSDWKAKTKKKAALINRDLHSTGGGPAKSKPLNPLEQRILQIMGLATITGQEALQEAGFGVTTQSQTETNFLSPTNEMQLEVLPPSTTIDHEDYTIHTSPQRTPSPQPGPSRTADRETSYRPMHEVRPPASVPSTPRRYPIRRRRPQQTAFDRATTEFVAIEERRLQLERDRMKQQIELETSRLKLEAERLQIEAQRVQLDQERLLVERERSRLEENRAERELEINRSMAALNHSTTLINNNLQELTSQLKILTQKILRPDTS